MESNGQLSRPLCCPRPPACEFLFLLSRSIRGCGALFVAGAGRFAMPPREMAPFRFVEAEVARLRRLDRVARHERWYALWAYGWGVSRVRELMRASLGPDELLQGRNKGRLPTRVIELPDIPRPIQPLLVPDERPPKRYRQTTIAVDDSRCCRLASSTRGCGGWARGSKLGSRFHGGLAMSTRGCGWLIAFGLLPVPAMLP